MKRHLPTIALLGTLTFISGYLTFPIGPVPLTCQTLIVLLTGIMLPPKEAAWAQMIHILLKFITMGVGLVLLPSLGFLISFPIMASLLSWYYRKNNKVGMYLISGIVMVSLLSYLIGLSYMWFALVKIMGNPLSLIQIIQMGMLVFIPGDILKGIIVYQLAKRLKHIKNRVS